MTERSSTSPSWSTARLGQCLSLHFHENLTRTPTPAARLHATDTALADLCPQHRPKTMPPVPHCFVAYIDSALMREILYFVKKKRDTDAQHYCLADVLWTGFKVAKRRFLGQDTTPGQQLVLFNCDFFSQYRCAQNRTDRALPKQCLIPLLTLSKVEKDPLLHLLQWQIAGCGRRKQSPRPIQWP